MFGVGAYFHSSDNYNIEVFFLVAIIPNRVWVKGIAVKSKEIKNG